MSAVLRNASDPSSSALPESAPWAQVLLDALSHAAWLVNLEGRTLHINLLARQLLSVAREGVLPQLRDLIDEHEAVPSLFQVLSRALGDSLYLAEGGEERWVKLSTAPCVGPRGETAGTLITLEDITAARAAERELGRLRAELERRTVERTQLTQIIAELEELAACDSLTGLLNRRSLMERLGQETSRARRYASPLSLVMVDVDHFKRVNDTYGHGVGDVVIGHVARILQKASRISDIAARYGGEEFVLVLPHTDLEGAVVLAERIRLAVAHSPYRAGDRHDRVSISLGVATLGASHQTAEALIERADQALYRAKREGRDRVCADEDCAQPR